MLGENARRWLGQWAAIIVLVGSIFISGVSAGIGDGGSKCPDASCTPAPVGVQCQPRYERDDRCCPTWYCSNGQTAYGVSRSSSGGSGNSFSYSSSSSSGTGGGMPMQFPIGNPFGGFGNLFGGLFGR